MNYHGTTTGRISTLSTAFPAWTRKNPVNHPSKPRWIAQMDLESVEARVFAEMSKHVFGLRNRDADEASQTAPDDEFLLTE